VFRALLAGGIYRDVCGFRVSDKLPMKHKVQCDINDILYDKYIRIHLTTNAGILCSTFFLGR
jgi:hypothetical protein